MEIDYFEIIKTNANVKLLSSNIYDIFRITTLKEGMPHVQRFDINFRILHPAVPNDSLIFLYISYSIFRATLIDHFLSLDFNHLRVYWSS